MDAISNFGYGTVTTAPSPATSGTTMVIGTATFAQFPDPATSGEYNVVDWATGTIPLQSNAEILRVSSKGTNGTINFARTQESTSARTIVVGDQVMLAPTKKVFDDIEQVGKANLIKNGNFINNSTNGYGGTPDDFTNSSGNPVQGGFPSFTKQQLIDLLGVVDGDIEGLWNLTEASGDATDLSSNAYNLTDNNTVTSSDDGLMGKARDFELANTEYFSIADANCANLRLTGSRTFFAWVKPESIGISNGIIIKDDNGSNGYLFYITTGNTPRVIVRGLTTNTIATADVTVEAGKWYFLVGVYDSTNTKLKIWVNGIKKEVTASGSSTDSGTAFYVGSRHNATDNYFDGLIQNAGVLSVALTDSQVKKLWAYTTYKGQKIRRATSNGNIYQTLDENLVERLRGKTVTMRATMWQDTASIGQININDGSDNKSTTTATTGSWVTVSKTITISATATAITLKLEVNTSDGNVWFKEVAFYEGSGVAPYSHSADDWARFPRLLKINPPAIQNAYWFEENRVFDYTPTTLTGFSANPSMRIRVYIKGKLVHIVVVSLTGGTSNATGFTMTAPVNKSSIEGNDNHVAFANVIDNGTITWGTLQINNAGSTIDVSKNGSFTGFTASGSKYCYGEIYYTIE